LSWTFCAAILILGATLFAHNVPSTPTAQDKAATLEMLAAAGHPVDQSSYGQLSDFEAQIKVIVAVQDSVLRATPKSAGLPLYHSREPADVLAAKGGLCFDRSRAIEKMLATFGLEVRHVAVFAVQDGQSRLGALLGSFAKSHAVSEVRTAKGWMLIDSNDRWIALDAARQPLDTSALHAAGAAERAWAAESTAPLNRIFRTPFTYVIGLYSRHGRFYWPYTPIPDYNLSQLLANLG
jgi:hypothetical protein